MTEAVRREFVGITDQALDDLRSRIGVRIHNTLEPWCYEATRDNIRHYAHGIGDDNPLWCDPDYARNTRYGDIIAPPTFIFACNRIISGYVGGMPGVHAMFAGCDFQWHKPIRRNAAITTEAYLKDLVEFDTKFAGRSVQQIYHVDFFDDTGEQLCAADSWCFRTDRDIARESNKKYGDLKAGFKRVYTDDELAEHYALYAAEQIQGQNPRRFSEVVVGARLPVMAKGPMTVTGFICYVQGWGGLYVRSNKLAWQQIHKHPALGIKNRFGIPDCPERVHWEEDMARKVGAPGAYDYGPERCSWMAHPITNWIGDDAMLVSLAVELRRHNLEGELLTVETEITGKREVGGRRLVDFALLAHNQDGELSCRAQASAELFAA